MGQPNLYTLRLKVTGAGLDDEYDQEFGFREFWMEGRKFFLNGTEIHLRQGCFYNGPRPQVGDNFSEMGSPTVDTRGDAADSGPDLDDADRQGIPGGRVCPQRQQVHDGPGRPAHLGAEPAAGAASAPPCGCATTAIIRPWSCGSPA